MRKSIGLFLLVLAMVMTACGGDEEKSEAGLDPNSPEGRGAAIFRGNCATCHDVKGDRVIIGPALTDVATRAETRVEGLTAEDYLYESIINPNDYVVEGYPEGSMPQNFGRDLTSEEINDLISYLLTLK